LKVRVKDGHYFGRVYYYVSHLPTDRFVYFVEADLRVVNCNKGRNNVADFIIRHKLGKDVLSGLNESCDYEPELCDKWEKEYEKRRPSKGLQDALIRDVFVGEGFKNIIEGRGIQTTFDVHFRPEYFNVVFEYQKQIDPLGV